jgi:hypothetical protein
MYDSQHEHFVHEMTALFVVHVMIIHHSFNYSSNDYNSITHVNDY